MYSKFFALEKDKQDRIINAALAEFARMGYDNASTNEIVKEAGVSKGILFHYFKNKKQLYLFLYDHLIELIMEQFYSKFNFDDRDIINRMHQGMSIKLELRKIYPEVFKFFEVAYLEKSSEVINELGERNLELIAENFAKMFYDVDTSMFKEGVDPSKVMQIITWAITGLADSLMQKYGKPIHIHYEEMCKEADLYIDILKKCFYK